MNQKARSLGVKVRLRTEAVSLLENNGQVIGVRVKTREGKLEDLQAKDIVIATGGFTANVPMRLKYDERLDASLFTTANPTGRGFDGSTGDGILLAEKTGAQTVDMEAIQLIPLRGGRLLNYVGGDIFVDSSGKRFVDESKGLKAIEEAYLNLPDRVFWVITDSQSQKSLDLDVAGYGLGTTFPVPRNRLRFFKFGLPGQPLISRDRLALQFSRFFSLFPC